MREAHFAGSIILSTARRRISEILLDFSHRFHRILDFAREFELTFAKQTFNLNHVDG
jgi:hypothetical protein